MWNRLWVRGRRAYLRASEFEAAEKVPACKAERATYGWPAPRFVFRVLFGGGNVLTTEPAEVARLTKGRADATVDIIPVR